MSYGGVTQTALDGDDLHSLPHNKDVPSCLYRHIFEMIVVA